jgi:hypothetical protein
MAFSILKAVRLTSNQLYYKGRDTATFICRIKTSKLSGVINLDDFVIETRGTTQ